MADLTYLLNEVYGLTNRPDMVAETTSVVKAATLKAHQSDYYWKDLFETVLVYVTADYTQSIDYRSIIPNFRSLSYLRKYDYDSNYNSSGSWWDGFQYLNNPTNTYSTNGTQQSGKFFKVLTPVESLDAYKSDRLDVVYGAGSLLQVKSSTLTKYAMFGCYLNPIVANEATFNSWVAADHPYAIIYQAVAQIYGLLENQVAFTKYQALADAEIARLMTANIILEGS